MQYEFFGEITQLEGKIKWAVVYFPYDTEVEFKTKDKVPVRVTIDGHEFEHMLLPSRNGHYFAYNEFMKRKVGKKLGDVVQVSLRLDESQRIVVPPEYVSEYLRTHGVLEAFNRQPDYMKREQLNHIELAKKDETKLNRLDTLIKRLGVS